MNAGAVNAHAQVENRRPTLMQVAGLTKRYAGQTALDDVSFDIRAGEVLGLIGPNGAGKTTLLDAIAGLIPDVDGGISFDGTPLPPWQRRTCLFFLPDGLRPWDEQYVVRVIEFFARVYRRHHTDVADTIHAFGLAAVLQKRVKELSKGFGRRLMLALAMLTPQPLLLLDEPFDGFDLRQTRDIMGLLRGYAVEGRTFLLAIHQLADAEHVCDRCVLLADGRVRGTGSMEELRARIGQPAATLEDVFLALT
jgi:ABC-2 type transport system ATP-binding protein